MRILFLAFLMGPLVWAEAYTFKHPDCEIRIQGKSKLNSAVYSTFEKKLKEKSFKAQLLMEDKKLFAGEMYALLEVDRPKTKFWKDCIVKIQIKQAKGTQIRKSDKTLFKKQVKSSFPRVTPSGDERCRRALKDSFTHIPHCRRP